MRKYVCIVCGYVYDEAKGIPEAGIAPGTRWEDLPDDWAPSLRCNRQNLCYRMIMPKQPGKIIAPDGNRHELTHWK